MTLTILFWGYSGMRKSCSDLPPVGEVEGVGPQAEHEDDDDDFLGGDGGLGHPAHVGRREYRAAAAHVPLQNHHQ